MKQDSITDLLDRLSSQLQDELNQRLNQIEFQSDYPYRLESCIGLVETLCRNIGEKKRITCLRVSLDGGTEFVITTNLEWAHQYVANIRAEVISDELIEEIVERQYGGVAALTFLG